MIIGIGTDIVQIRRIRRLIENYESRFLDRCFTPAERKRADARAEPFRAYARLFAAKEALLKALGTGMREGLSWQDWEIMPDALGAPTVTVTGGARERLSGKTIDIRLSMSDDHDYAVASAIIQTKLENECLQLK